MTRRSVFFGALDCAVAIFVNRWADPRFVFASDHANALAFGIALLMPLVMALAGAPTADRWLRGVVTVALWLMAPIGVLGAAIIVIVTSLSADITPTMMSAGRYTLAVFESDGAPTDEGVDQVCRVLPGVMFARHLRYDRGLEIPQIDVLGPSRVRIDGELVALRPLIWPLC